MQWCTDILCRAPEDTDKYLDPSHIPTVGSFHGRRRGGSIDILIFAEWKQLLVVFFVEDGDLHALAGGRDDSEEMQSQEASCRGEVKRMQAPCWPNHWNLLIFISLNLRR